MSHQHLTLATCRFARDPTVYQAVKMILVWWDQFATLARIEFERWSVNVYYLQQNLQSSPLQHRIGRSQKDLTRCREVIFTAVVGWIFWSWQERFASGGQDGLVSVMTPVRGSSFGSCQVSWPVKLRGKYFCLLHDLIYVLPRTQRSTSFFGWLTGSILWVKSSKISVSYWGFR